MGDKRKTLEAMFMLGAMIGEVTEIEKEMREKWEIKKPDKIEPRDVPKSAGGL